MAWVNDYWPLLAGGALVGAAAALLMLVNGRAAGLGNMLEHVLAGEPGQDYWRLWFLLGLLLPAPLFINIHHLPALPDYGGLLLAGLLVGVGCQLIGSCLSGYAVCGVANFSWRSALVVLATVAAAMFANHFWPQLHG